MRITVNLDTDSILTLPSPVALKAKAVTDLTVVFRRGANNAEVVSEDGATGSIRVGTRYGAFAENALEADGAGGFKGSVDLTDCPRLDHLFSAARVDVDASKLVTISAWGEITWTISGKLYRSATFPVLIEEGLH